LQNKLETLEEGSFTLTMWDVKDRIKEIERAGFNSFTLTMWDVK